LLFAEGDSRLFTVEELNEEEPFCAPVFVLVKRSRVGRLVKVIRRVVLEKAFFPILSSS
jgi:hypothetical protein